MNFLIIYKIAFVFVIDTLNFNLAKSLQKIRTHLDICGSIPETYLSEDGEGSSLTVHLRAGRNSNVCTLIVKAPNTNIVNVQLIDTYPKLNVNDTIRNGGTSTTRCLLDIYLPDNRKTAIWRGDLCNDESLLDIGLLPNNIHLVWRPPINEKHVIEKKLVLTAVGQGENCQKPGHHACLSIGWDPLLCISDHLLCDGISHCPKNSLYDDEDESLCKNYQNQWQQFADNLIKNFQKNNLLNIKWIQEKAIETFNDTDLNDLKNEYEDLMNFNNTSNDKKTERRNPDSVAFILSQYSPWSYIMLGMLMCAVLLFFCGLWECCFRIVKEDNENSQTPSSIDIIQTSQIQTNDTQPPNYFELDQPPSYNSLFPIAKDNDNVVREMSDNNICIINVQELIQQGDTTNVTIDSTNHN